MCDLRRGKKQLDEKPDDNMIILKIHGGITKEDIYKQIEKAVETSRRNKEKGIDQTVLFFDEANTTSAISTIKTIMCDRFFDGKPIPENTGLQFVAAVNPYRQHSDEMIAKLETAGLGYHIKASMKRFFSEFRHYFIIWP